MESPKLVEVSLLDDHPENPRLGYREDVISALAENMNGGFPPEHSLIVRPVGDRYQIISGHHRRRAAAERGFESVYCWVRDYSDDEAYMLLGSCNSQGELTPLELGYHLMGCVKRGIGGSGKKQGIAEYARRMGIDQSNCTKYLKAAEVHSSLGEKNLGTGTYLFSDKALHLSEIGKLPKEIWPRCVAAIMKNTNPDGSTSWSRQLVAERVSEAKDFLKEHEIPEEWQDYLEPNLCALQLFKGVARKEIYRLLDAAEKTFSALGEDSEEIAAMWRQWLVDHRDDEDCSSFKMKELQDKRIELEQAIFDMKELALPVDRPAVILADPPWKYDFAQTNNRQIENQYPTATPEEIASHIKAAWMPKPADDAVLFMWATAPKLREALYVMEQWGFEYKTHAVWDKEKIGMGYWFRGQHELLLVGTRGKFSPPDPEKRVASMFREKRDSKHSKKPAAVYEAIESMFPAAVRCEVYQRSERPGWIGVGNESPGDK